MAADTSAVTALAGQEQRMQISVFFPMQRRLLAEIRTIIRLVRIFAYCSSNRSFMSTSLAVPLQDLYTLGSVVYHGGGLRRGQPVCQAMIQEPRSRSRIWSFHTKPLREIVGMDPHMTREPPRIIIFRFFLEVPTGDVKFGRSTMDLEVEVNEYKAISVGD